MDKDCSSKGNFWTFQWLTENSHNFSSHIWNYKSVNFASMCSVMTDNSFVLFLAKTSYYIDKRSPSKCQILDFWFHQMHTLIGSLCWKHIKSRLKKYIGIMFHDTEESCKIWRKTDSLLRKWYEKFGKFSPEHLKVSKLVLLWDPFVQSRKTKS